MKPFELLKDVVKFLGISKVKVDITDNKGVGIKCKIFKAPITASWRYHAKPGDGKLIFSFGVKLRFTAKYGQATATNGMSSFGVLPIEGKRNPNEVEGHITKLEPEFFPGTLNGIVRIPFGGVPVVDDKHYTVNTVKDNQHVMHLIVNKAVVHQVLGMVKKGELLFDFKGHNIVIIDSTVNLPYKLVTTRDIVCYTENGKCSVAQALGR